MSERKPLYDFVTLLCISALLLWLNYVSVDLYAQLGYILGISDIVYRGEFILTCCVHVMGPPHFRPPVPGCAVNIQTLVLRIVEEEERRYRGG